MKKLTKRYKSALIYRARKNSKKIKSRARRAYRKAASEATFTPFIVNTWDGSINQKALCVRKPVTPPEHINFGDSIDETLVFLKRIRDGIGKKRHDGSPQPGWLKKKNGRLPRLGTFHDYSLIKSISVSAALVIASCYDRARRISGTTPPAINHQDWPDSVFRVLSDVGFFKFIGHKPPDNRGSFENQLKICSAISGRNANGLEECSNEILELLKFLSYSERSATAILAEVNSVVSEAMINVARHAYPQNFVEESPYDTIDQWWMTAQADRHNQTLTVVVYDQGATIPGTLPHKEWYQKYVEKIMQHFRPDFDYHRDAQHLRTLDPHFINHSMKKGKTQTNDPQRGLGLPQMQSLIDQCKDGSLTIVSRAGLYRYKKGNGVTKRALPLELEGTLVEWHITLPKV